MLQLMTLLYGYYDYEPDYHHHGPDGPTIIIYIISAIIGIICLVCFFRLCYHVKKLKEYICNGNMPAGGAPSSAQSRPKVVPEDSTPYTCKDGEDKTYSLKFFPSGRYEMTLKNGNMLSVVENGRYNYPNIIETEFSTYVSRRNTASTFERIDKDTIVYRGMTLRH